MTLLVEKERPVWKAVQWTGDNVDEIGEITIAKRFDALAVTITNYKIVLVAKKGEWVIANDNGNIGVITTKEKKAYWEEYK